MSQKEANETMDKFFQQFPKDEHAKIVLDYIFRLIYNKKDENISLPSEKKPTGV